MHGQQNVKITNLVFYFSQLQDSQATYRVTMKYVRATVVAVEKQQAWHILSVFAALGIQHAMRRHSIVICGLPASTVFFHIIKKLLDIKYIFCFLYNFCLKDFVL